MELVLSPSQTYNPTCPAPDTYSVSLISLLILRMLSYFPQVLLMPPSNSKALKKRRSNKSVRSSRPFDIDKSSSGTRPTPPEKLRKRAHYRRSLRKEFSPNTYPMTPSHWTAPLTKSPHHSDRNETATTPAQKIAVRETLEGTPDFFTYEIFFVSTLKKMAFGFGDGLQVVPLTIVPPNSPAEGLLQ